jgi:hypothetical protein
MATRLSFFTLKLAFWVIGTAMVTHTFVTAFVLYNGGLVADEVNESVSSQYSDMSNKLSDFDLNYLLEHHGNCTQRSARNLFLPFTAPAVELAGWHGFSRADESVIKRYVGQIMKDCSRSFVLEAPSYDDAVKRNLLLSKAQINPFPVSEMSSIARLF